MRSLLKMRATKSSAIQQISSKEEFAEILQTCYFTAQQLELELPNLIDSCSSFELSAVLTDAIPIAQRHSNRIAELFHYVNLPAPRLPQLGVKSDFTTLHNLRNEFASGFSLDNAIILQVQKVISTDIENMNALLHYLADDSAIITSYLTSAILQEKAAHRILTEIALQAIYFERAV